jgi:hypothetical protein
MVIPDKTPGQELLPCDYRELGDAAQVAIPRGPRTGWPEYQLVRPTACLGDIEVYQRPRLSWSGHSDGGRASPGGPWALHASRVPAITSASRARRASIVRASPAAVDRGWPETRSTDGVGAPTSGSGTTAGVDCASSAHRTSCACAQSGQKMRRYRPPRDFTERDGQARNCEHQDGYGSAPVRELGRAFTWDRFRRLLSARVAVVAAVTCRLLERTDVPAGIDDLGLGRCGGRSSRRRRAGVIVPAVSSDLTPPMGRNSEDR